MIGVIEQIALAVMVFIVMLGMGATMSLSAVKVALTRPLPLLIGMFSQFGLMPLIGLILGLIFNLPAAVALSLIIVGSTPGGTTSNLFTYYARGDVALSVSMTVASTFAAIILMPLAIMIYASGYTSQDLQIPLAKIVVTLLLVLIPVTLGMFVQAKNARVAQRLEKTSSIVGALMIAVLVANFLIKNREIFLSTSLSILAAAMLLGLVGFLLGYWLARLAGQSRAICRTISLETGIQNTPLTIAVISLTFPTGAVQDEMLLLPSFYAFFVVLTSAVVSYGYRRLAR